MRLASSNKGLGLIVLAALVFVSFFALQRLDWRSLLFRPTFVAPYSLASVQIFVQDEHQNALPRWHDLVAAKERTSYYLVHIDAHSDGAAPITYTTSHRRPLGPPFTRESVRSGNDDFVVNAIHAGIIHGWTWIMPDWTKEHDLFRTPGTSYRLRSGHTVLDPKLAINDYSVMDAFAMQDAVVRGERTRESFTAAELNGVACACEESRKEGQTAWELAFCFNILSSLEPAQCAADETIPTTYLPGSQARQFGIPVPPPSADSSADVILDIDLDYFSVQDPLPGLIAAGWDNGSLGVLDQVIEQLCAPNEREEHWLAARIHEMVAEQELTSLGFDMDRYVCSDVSESFGELFVRLQSAVADVREGHSEAQVAAMMAALHATGFSVQVRSFRGPEPEFPAPMAIVTGTGQNIGSFYTVNENILNYAATPSELNNLLAEFRTYLLASGLGPRVAIVTLVRSVRDGYLPQERAEQLQSAVLAVLHEMLPDAEVIIDGRRAWGVPQHVQAILAESLPPLPSK